jgi:hypothetical protein
MELNASQNLTPELKRRSASPFKQKEIGALEIAAEQVRYIKKVVWFEFCFNFVENKIVIILC